MKVIQKHFKNSMLKTIELRYTYKWLLKLKTCGLIKSHRILSAAVVLIFFRALFLTDGDKIRKEVAVS